VFKKLVKMELKQVITVPIYLYQPFHIHINHKGHFRFHLQKACMNLVYLYLFLS
jgi:hypothetical protein